MAATPAVAAIDVAIRSLLVVPVALVVCPPSVVIPLSDEWNVAPRIGFRPEAAPYLNCSGGYIWVATSSSQTPCENTTERR
jgi:hypothetical protein